MRAWRARNQLESEMAQAEAALADLDPSGLQPNTPEWTDGYWYGRYHGLREAIHLMKEVENHHE